MEVLGSCVEYKDKNQNTIKENLLTYSEEEKQQNEINRENAKHVFTPEFIPFYPAVQIKYNLSTTETLLYGFIRFFMANNKNRFYFTNEQLAKILNTSESTINISINNLAKVSLIEKSHKPAAGKGTVRFINKIRVSENCYSEYQKTDSQSIRKLIGNNNKINKNKIKELISIADSQSSPADNLLKNQINELIDLFKEINPDYKRFFSNITERKAVESILKAYGEDKLLSILKVIPRINVTPYAPNITSPSQLKLKWAALNNFLEKQKRTDIRLNNGFSPLKQVYEPKY